MKYAVRCCCQPLKVLGYMELPSGLDSVRVMEKVDWNSDRVPPVHVAQVRTVRLQDGSSERAIYSDDRGIEFWEKIAGFIPVGKLHKQSAKGKTAMELTDEQIKALRMALKCMAVETFRQDFGAATELQGHAEVIRAMLPARKAAEPAGKGDGK